MPLNSKQFVACLKDGLRPVYLLAGDEPLLIQEAADRLRTAAREQNYAEREVLQVGPGFEWNWLRDAGANLSLFANRRLIELRMDKGKPGREGAQALKDYAKAPPPDTILIVITGSLDKSARSSAWFKALESAGAALYAWPVETNRLPGWLTQRMRAAGLQVESGTAEELATLTEGNLLAASQAVSRLVLLYPGARITPEQVRECVFDNARFDVFDLTRKMFSGQAGAALRSLDRLREEGTEPPLVLWAVVRELRSVAAVCGRARRGETLGQALAGERVHWKSKDMVGQAARRLGERRVLGLLQQAAHADHVAKGAAPGQPWEELVELCAGVASGVSGT